MDINSFSLVILLSQGGGSDLVHLCAHVASCCKAVFTMPILTTYLGEVGACQFAACLIDGSILQSLLFLSFGAKGILRL